MPSVPSRTLFFSLLAILAGALISRSHLVFDFLKQFPSPLRSFSSSSSALIPRPTTLLPSKMGHPTLAELEAYWATAFEELPSTPDNIPAFFFGHGSPILAFPKEQAAQMGEFAAYGGPGGPLSKFLSVFGPMLLEKYKPKAIVVFSAHWETARERLGETSRFRVSFAGLAHRVVAVTDYEENPLLMDYYGFPPALYQLKFKSRGNTSLAQRVVDLYKKVR